MLIVDDLVTWLVGLLADAGRKKLTRFVSGSEQEQALRSAVTAAVELTAGEVRPDDEGMAEDVSRVINQVFTDPMPEVSLAKHGTVLEAIQAGVAEQLTVWTMLP